MSLFDRWRARTDDARRTKGDPPPTVDQLLALVKQQGEINRNLRSQVDGLNAVNKELRTALADKSDYIGQLALEIAEATSAKRGLMPLLSLDPDPTRPYIREREEKS